MTASSSRSRLIRKLRDALGETICAALEDVDVVEVMLNPDGRLFVERLGEGIDGIGELAQGAAEIIIGSVAHALQTEADENKSGKHCIGPDHPRGRRQGRQGIKDQQDEDRDPKKYREGA